MSARLIAKSEEAMNHLFTQAVLSDLIQHGSNQILDRPAQLGLGAFIRPTTGESLPAIYS